MADTSVLFTLRKHWKKSLFAAGLISYGFHYGGQKFRDYLIRREYFLKAKTYGERLCSPLEKPRRLYVILNPHAGNSKSKKLFQKNAAPIFYLAGIDITYIQTDYEGHSKTMANYFDPTVDGIVVAGGDGTLQEVVTGILRQPENDHASQQPLGFIPLGHRSNFMHRKLFGDGAFQVRSICEAAMSIVKGHTRKVNVMEIKTDSKPVFAFSSLHIGANQEVKQQINEGRFWLLGPLKSYFVLLWKTIRNWPPNSAVSYASSTSSVKNISNEIPNRIPQFHLQTVSCQGHSEERNGYINNGQTSSSIPCDVVLSANTRTLMCSCGTVMCSCDSYDVINCANGVSTQNTEESSSISLYLHEADDEKNGYLILQNLKIDQSKIEFLEYGHEWMKNKFEYTETELSEVMACKEVAFTPPEHEDVSYDIDGELFDARPIQVSIHPRKITMFCKPSS